MMDGLVSYQQSFRQFTSVVLGSFQNCAAKFFIVIALLLSFHGCPTEQVVRFEKRKIFFPFEMPRA